MKLKAYCLYDIKVSTYGLPFFLHHDHDAFRMLYEAGMDQRTNVHKFPYDYVLYKVGMYDQATGSFENHALTSLGTVASIVSQNFGTPGGVSDVDPQVDAFITTEE